VHEAVIYIKLKRFLSPGIKIRNTSSSFLKAFDCLLFIGADKQEESESKRAIRIERVKLKFE